MDHDVPPGFGETTDDLRADALGTAGNEDGWLVHGQRQSTHGCAWLALAT